MPSTDSDDFRAALRNVVYEAGDDFVYEPMEGCNYFVNRNTTPEPSCLIGQVLHRLGFSADEVQEVGADTVLSELGFPSDTVTAATVAQQLQDQRVPWGICASAFRATEYALEAASER